MAQGSITVPVKLTAQNFWNFAIYDTLVRQRRWVLPIVFCMLLSFFAGVCNALRERSEGSETLVAVLLVIGVGLPVVYFASFFHSVRLQIKRLGLDQPKPAYTVKLDDEGVHVTSGEQKADHTWSSLYRAYHMGDAVYLYPSPKQAYLLPYADTDPDQLWAFLDAHLPNEKLFRRPKK